MYACYYYGYTSAMEEGLPHNNYDGAFCTF